MLAPCGWEQMLWDHVEQNQEMLKCQKAGMVQQPSCKRMTRLKEGRSPEPRVVPWVQLPLPARTVRSHSMQAPLIRNLFAA